MSVEPLGQAVRQTEVLIFADEPNATITCESRNELRDGYESMCRRAIGRHVAKDWGFFTPLYSHREGSSEIVARFVNDVSVEGWELITVCKEDEPHFFRYYFRREKATTA